MPEEIPTSPRIESLRQRLASDPDSRLFLQLAEEYRRAGALELAARTCREGLEKHPTYHAARVALARACVQLGKIKEAVSELKQVLSASPDNILAGKLLGQIYESAHRPRRALAIYRRLLPYDPYDEDLLSRIEVLGAGAGPQGPEPVEDVEEGEIQDDERAGGRPAGASAGETARPPSPGGAEPSRRPGEGYEGTAILDEPPEIGGGSARSFMRPGGGLSHPGPQTEEAAPSAPGASGDRLPPEMKGEINRMTHDLHQELDQAPAEQLPDTLDLTPSPDLLPSEIRTEDGETVIEREEAPTSPSQGPEERVEGGDGEEQGGGEGVVSRTMAEVFYRQGHLDRAIETMERLVLADRAGKEDEEWLAGLMAERGDRLVRRLERPGPEEVLLRRKLEVYREWLGLLERA